MNFVGREAELNTLEREYIRSSSFVVVYGRRRVGKTTLIKQSIKGKKALYFLASQETSQQSMNDLTNRIASFTKQTFLEKANLGSWEQAFRAFAEYEPEQKRFLLLMNFSIL